jgi:4-carboxymuconolactone decarboxylase
MSAIRSMQAGGGIGPERMPPLAPEQMDEAQKKRAAELTAGPRGGVKGPFIPLLRSPELMDRLQKVGEYLRFQSSLEPRISEFLMLIVSREWTQQFEWFVHLPLALKAGIAAETALALEEGRRPAAMAEDEAIAWDFCGELLRLRGVSETTYRRAVARFGESGVIDMLGVLGYFTTVSMVMNVAHSPAQRDPANPRLAAFPL